MENVFLAAQELLRGRFAPLTRDGRRPPGTISLVEALYQAHGMVPDATCLAYYEWDELHRSLAACWQILDSYATSRVGAPVRAEVWAAEPDRSENEVMELLAAAAEVADVASPPSLMMRPWCKASRSGAITRRRQTVLCGAVVRAWAKREGLALPAFVVAVGAEPLATITDDELLRRLDADDDRTPVVSKVENTVTAALRRGWNRIVREIEADPEGSPPYRLGQFLDWLVLHHPGLRFDEVDDLFPADDETRTEIG